jgi:hypothetical protein
MSASENILNELVEIEAWAEGLREKCHQTRMLLQQEAGVSTSSKGQPALSKAELARVSARRKARLKKRH